MFGVGKKLSALLPSVSPNHRCLWRIQAGIAMRNTAERSLSDSPSKADIQSAKSQLQNALTIEWDQNKTVLVDLEGKGDRSDEVELNGFGSASSHLIGKDRSEYGRLGDDENVCRTVAPNLVV